MEEQSVRQIIHATHWTRKMATASLAMLALFLFILSLSALKSYWYIGSGVTATNTISVQGSGEEYAVPDTATFSVTVIETAKDVKSAQDAATKKGNDILAYLKGQEIDEKDIQTTDYNISPQYEYRQTGCTPTEVTATMSSSASYSCPSGKQVLTGYQVSETFTVKVRKTDKAGDILAGVGSKGASQVSGLTFTVDNPDAIEAKAREKAIEDAKKKAEVLAKDLGVGLVRIVGFNENGNGRVYYSKAMSFDSAAGGVAPQAAPAIATGQNKYTSDISITYEIR